MPQVVWGVKIWCGILFIPIILYIHTHYIYTHILRDHRTNKTKKCIKYWYSITLSNSLAVCVTNTPTNWAWTVCALSKSKRSLIDWFNCRRIKCRIQWHITNKAWHVKAVQYIRVELSARKRCCQHPGRCIFVLYSVHIFLSVPSILRNLSRMRVVSIVSVAFILNWFTLCCLFDTCIRLSFVAVAPLKKIYI